MSEDTFSTAFRRAALRVRRAEEPDREDIDLILPLAWDHKGGVVRVTFSRGSRNAASPVPPLKIRTVWADCLSVPYQRP